MLLSADGDAAIRSVDCGRQAVPDRRNPFVPAPLPLPPELLLLLLSPPLPLLPLLLLKGQIRSLRGSRTATMLLSPAFEAQSPSEAKVAAGDCCTCKPSSGAPGPRIKTPDGKLPPCDAERCSSSTGCPLMTVGCPVPATLRVTSNGTAAAAAPVNHTADASQRSGAREGHGHDAAVA